MSAAAAPHGLPPRVCRVCGSSSIGEAGRVEYLQGFDCRVFDCGDCGCRFTPHDATVHRQFHAAPSISYYADYIGLAEQARVAFAARDLSKLSEQLRRWPKYRFVLDEVAREPASSRILEVGCSRGYLAAHSILEGRDILGVDVSEDAIAGARAAFGDHFALTSSERARSGDPYDLIYHVGMIGCVDDPIGITRTLLSRLRRGGRLVFNAPNRAALHQRGQLWFDSAPPPDLVTIFPEGFWKQRFGPDVIVQETVELLAPAQSMTIGLRNMVGHSWLKPAPQPSNGRGQVWSQRESGVWRWVDGAVRRGGTLVPPVMNLLAKPRATEFGLFVQMTARG